MLAKAVFRPDIEGLRAVAVLSVLVYHAGLPLRGGYVGVDVFFVISGFLITSLILREVDKTGRISLVGFYARRVKRLLPAASAVLLVCVPMTACWAPPTDQEQFAHDVVATAAYVVNWRFAERSVDYLAEDVGRSPVLHFWSLSVEEQFYFVWPLLMVLAVALARRLGRRLRPTTVLTLSLVLVPSLVWSVAFTRESQSEAFFVTTTRLWELGVGALTALALPFALRLPERIGTVLVWQGALLVVGSTVVFDEATTWPGTWASVPTLGTALVIAGGSFGQGGLVTQLLSCRPMVWVGSLSYSLYLWHWPFVVAGQDWFGLEGSLWGMVLVSASFVPAWLSYRFVERPVRFAPSLAARPLTTLSLGANLSCLGIIAGLVLAADHGAERLTLDESQEDRTRRTGAEEAEQPKGEREATTRNGTTSRSVALGVREGRVVAQPRSLGAGALGREPKLAAAGRPQDSYTSFTPSPRRARRDVPRAYKEGCQARGPGVEPRWCEIGDPKGERRAVVLGDSKILQYYEALDAVGKAGGWRLSTATKAACPSTDAVSFRHRRPSTTCYEFNQRVMQHLEREPPDAVITSQYASSAFMPGQDPEPTPAGMVQGLVSRWSKLRALGANVVVVLDNPVPKDKVYECMARHAEGAKRCSFERRGGIEKSAAPVQREAAAKVPGVRLIDVTDYICPQSQCAPVIGDVLVYRQSSHITNTYARTLAPMLAPPLLEAMNHGARERAAAQPPAPGH